MELSFFKGIIVSFSDESSARGVHTSNAVPPPPVQPKPVVKLSQQQQSLIQSTPQETSEQRNENVAGYKVTFSPQVATFEHHRISAASTSQETHEGFCEQLSF